MILNRRCSIIPLIFFALSAIILAEKEEAISWKNYNSTKADFLYGQFPKDFVWSIGTSAYQIEGAWNTDGKGESLWDQVSQTGRCKGGDMGDVACDSYRLYETDVEMIKALKLKHYRFSLAWTRIQPDGEGDSNQAGINYYNKLINKLIENGIEPQVTLFHWDIPSKLQDKGGHLNEEFANWFGNYARICFAAFGDRVKFWFTINEVFNVAMAYGEWSNIAKPGSYDETTGRYIVAHNLLLAHARAYHIYDNEFRPRQEGKIAVINDNHYWHPASNRPEDLEASERYMQFTMGWIMHPIFSTSGDYPQIMKDYVRNKSLSDGRNESRLPSFTSEQVAYVKGTSDFIAVNFYTSHTVRQRTTEVTDDSRHARNTSYALHTRDADVSSGELPGAVCTESGWLYIVPTTIGYEVRWLRKEYGDIPIYITENGVDDNGGLNDQRRIDYHISYINDMLKAIKNDGINVKGYTLWALMDNFEWLHGYGSKFGVYSVNFSDPNRARTMKESGRVYRKIVLDNGFLEDPVSQIDTVDEPRNREPQKTSGSGQLHRQHSVSLITVALLLVCCVFHVMLRS